MKARPAFFLLVTILMSVGYYKYHRWHQQSMIQGALDYGRLAPLPEKAIDVQVDTEGSMFSRTFWLCFKADKAVIDNWVAQSSSLSKQAPSPLPIARKIMGDNPDWFLPQLTTEGVNFAIPWDNEQLYGEVWIDYSRGIVYIKTSHS